MSILRAAHDVAKFVSEIRDSNPLDSIGVRPLSNVVANVVWYPRPFSP